MVCSLVSLIPVLLLLNSVVVEVDSHGMLLVPPARSSAWREDPIRFDTNVDDNTMFCGGVDRQYRINGGKCSICGEPYDGIKEYEKGGALYKGFIVRSYAPGQMIKTKIQLTANHYGWFEFRLCNLDPLNGAEATHECLNQNLLEIDGSGQTRHLVKTKKSGYFYVNVKLPDGLTCNHCLLQWRYHAGNSWGFDETLQQGCMGCGNQEEFYGCSDISIGASPSDSANSEAMSIPSSDSADRNSVRESHWKKEFSGTNSDEEKAQIPKRLLKELLNELKQLRARSSSKQDLVESELNDLV